MPSSSLSKVLSDSSDVSKLADIREAALARKKRCPGHRTSVWSGTSIVGRTFEVRGRVNCVRDTHEPSNCFDSIHISLDDANTCSQVHSGLCHDAREKGKWYTVVLRQPQYMFPRLHLSVFHTRLQLPLSLVHENIMGRARREGVRHFSDPAGLPAVTGTRWRDPGGSVDNAV